MFHATSIRGQVRSVISVLLPVCLAGVVCALPAAGSAAGKRVSTPPTGAGSQSVLSWIDASSTLYWLHYHAGDYDQNGEVNAADMVRVAAHFGEDPGNPNWQDVVDGDGNELISIADLTPIGINFRTDSAAYAVYQGETDSGPWQLVGNVPFSAHAGDPLQQRISFAYAPSHIPGSFYYVVHVDALGSEGAMSNVVGTP